MTVPQRPQTPDYLAAEAHERLMHYLFVEISRQMPDPEKYIEDLRRGVLNGFTRKPIIEQDRQQVADHIDWFLALVGASLGQTSQ